VLLGRLHAGPAVQPDVRSRKYRVVMNAGAGQQPADPLWPARVSRPGRLPCCRRPAAVPGLHGILRRETGWTAIPSGWSLHTGRRPITSAAGKPSLGCGSRSTSSGAPGPLSCFPVPVPHRSQPPARPLSVMDPQGRSQDHHPHVQPAQLERYPPVRQHQAPPRAGRRARDALSRSRRASRRMDTNMRPLRPSQQVQQGHAVDNLRVLAEAQKPPRLQRRHPENGLEILRRECALRVRHPL
jgi:hypothetical protein